LYQLDRLALRDSDMQVIESTGAQLRRRSVSLETLQVKAVLVEPQLEKPVGIPCLTGRLGRPGVSEWGGPCRIPQAKERESARRRERGIAARHGLEARLQFHRRSAVLHQRAVGLAQPQFLAQQGRASGLHR